MKLKFIIFLFWFFLVTSKVWAYYNIETVNNTWLRWTNEQRRKNNLWDLVINPSLNKTALEWATYSKNKWAISHKRPGQKSYYDYKKITSWFSSRWLTFPKIGWSTFSESIWRNTYSCSQKDCTESLSQAIYKTFAMYLREKWKKYSPHYSAIINKNFKQIGIGIVVDETKKKYYLTIHYATQVLAKK